VKATGILRRSGADRKDLLREEDRTVMRGGASHTRYQVSNLINNSPSEGAKGPRNLGVNTRSLC